MSKSGFGSLVGFRSQAAFGVPLVPNVFVEFDEESLKWSGGKTAKPSLRSVSQKRNVKQKVSVSGGLTLPFRVQGIEALLLHGFGAVDTSVIVADEVFEHEFSLAQALPAHGLTTYLQRGELDKAWTYDSNYVTKLGFKQNIEEELMLAVELLGRDEALDDPIVGADVDTDLEIFAWDNVATLKFNEVDFPGKVVELNVENGLTADSYQLGLLTRIGAIRNAVRKITGKLELEIDSVAYHTLFKQFPKIPLEILWGGSQIGDNAGHNYELELNAPACFLDTSEINIKGTEPITQALPFTLYALDTNDELTARLKNGTAAVA